MQTPEQRLTKQIMIWCGEHDILCHHLNVGQFKLPDGRYFNTGIPKGFPDLQLIGHGWVAYVETKIHPRKPTSEQLAWLELLNKRNIPATCVYSLEEFVDFIKSKGLL